MARLVLITDTHFGIKGGSDLFHDNMQLFYNEVFFPYIANNLKSIDGYVHLGDVFHDRRKIDTNSAKRARQYFFQPLFSILKSTGKVLHVICGNHDSFFKNTLDTNSLEEFLQFQNYDLSGYKWLQVHTEPTDISTWNTTLIPWITDVNREQITSHIARSPSKYAFGHLELSGFNYSKVSVASHGDDPAGFAKFVKVLSGHYHYKHGKDNIYYLGTPTQQTWADLDTPRGFHIFDTETGKLEFIGNPYNIFQQINITDPIPAETTHARYFRLYRDGTEKQSDVDKYIKSLYDIGAIDVTIIVKNNGDGGLSESSNQVNQSVNIEDTPTFIRNNVTEPPVADLMITLYNRAVNEQVNA